MRRKAGDILGSDQAGFIDSVGIDLYMKMLDEEVNRIKGIEVKEESDDSIVLNVSSHIKDSYVSDEDVKIEIHKLVNEIDSFETLKKTKNLLEDRFGPCDDDLISYMNEQLFENLCKKLGILRVFDNNIYREVFLDKDTSSKINYEDLFIKALDINKRFSFSYKNDLIGIKLLYDDTDNMANSFNNLFKELL